MNKKKNNKKHKGVNETQFQLIWRRFRKRPSAMIGLVLVTLLILMSIFADVLYDYDEYVISQDVMNSFLRPCLEHPFGTDDYGRDILARIVHGSRLSLGISFSAVALSAIGGTAIGSVVGYFGGRADMIVMRVVDIFMAIPSLLMAMIVVSVFGTNPATIALSLGIAGIPSFTRVARGAVLTVRDQEYIESARAIGAKNSTILMKHILPNCFAPILVQVTINIAIMILSVSGLSYLGMGIEPPSPEWGSMLSSARDYINTAGYMAIFPGLFIVLTILGLNLVGDGVRDATDPKLR